MLKRGVSDFEMKDNSFDTCYRGCVSSSSVLSSSKPVSAAPSMNDLLPKRSDVESMGATSALFDVLL